jgi:hypothetical protein
MRQKVTGTVPSAVIRLRKPTFSLTVEAARRIKQHEALRKGQVQLLKNPYCSQTVHDREALVESLQSGLVA